MNKPNTKQYVEAAERLYEKKGHIEIEQNAQIWRGDSGAYIQAWVWVYDEQCRPG